MKFKLAETKRNLPVGTLIVGSRIGFDTNLNLPLTAMEHFGIVVSDGDDVGGYCYWPSYPECGFEMAYIEQTDKYYYKP
jgi:hypothetical protein